MLGIVIGVASIVIVLAIGEGAQLRLEEQIRAIGANVLMITPGAVRQGAVRLKAGTKLTLTEGDVQSILEQIPEIRAAAGSIAGAAQVIHENKNWNTTINGTTTAHFMVRDWELAAGRYFLPSEEAGAGKVAILGNRVAHELLSSGESPIGAQIRILNTPLEVIGVLDAKGPDQDDVLFVPLSTGERHKSGRRRIRHCQGRIGRAACRRKGGNRKPAQATPPHSLRSGRRFPGTGSRGRHGGAARRHSYGSPAVDSDRPGFAGRRRDQHHEYHDCFGRRAHA
jgi:hypothetical protein